MKYVIAGGRDYNNFHVTEYVLNQFTNIETIISGDARGADTQGAIYGQRHNIPVEHYPAHWDEYGKAAGYIRNAEMGEAGDALIAFWDGQSKGTMNMIKTMKLLKKPYWIYDYQGKLVGGGNNNV